MRAAMVKPYTDLASGSKTTITEHPGHNWPSGLLSRARSDRLAQAEHCGLLAKQTLKAKPKVLPGTAHRVTEVKAPRRFRESVRDP